MKMRGYECENSEIINYKLRDNCGIFEDDVRIQYYCVKRNLISGV